MVFEDLVLHPAEQKSRNRRPASDSTFIRSDMPVQEIVFRTLLARNNRPMSLTDLHYELTEKWATPVRPIVITEERLLRILDKDTYYGFARK